MKISKLKVLELTWLGVSILSFFTGTHSWYTKGLNKDTLVFFIITTIGIAMYFFRRKTRKIND